MRNASENKDIFEYNKGVNDVCFPQSGFLATVRQRERSHIPMPKDRERFPKPERCCLF